MNPSVDTTVERQPLGSVKLIGQSVPMQKVYGEIRRAASADIFVLLLGETGTGKDLVAEAIHRQSARRDGVYLAAHLGALPAELVGSELFGHERGAFTGATERREGVFEQARGGTVFLDEIGTISGDVQVSLLRLLEEESFNRLGGQARVPCDVRLIAASNVDLSELVREGRFRRDLFYRLDVFPIVLPPLRQRAGDVKLLARAFLLDYCRLYEKEIRKISPVCMELLEAYHWPGNVRELKHVIQRGVIVNMEQVLLPEDLPPRFRQERACRKEIVFDVGMSLEEVQRRFILQTFASTGNNHNMTAKMLGISRRSLYDRLRRYRSDE